MSARDRATSFYSVPPPRFIPQTNSVPILPLTHVTESKRFKVGRAETIGRRKEMEDVTLVQGCFRGDEKQDLFALFDGHGGKEAAEVAAQLLIPTLTKKLLECNNNIKEALKETFVALNKALVDKGIKSGTTALVALIVDNILYVANVGDTRAVLSRNSAPVRLSFDHKPNLAEEKELIEKRGGFVANNRLNGQLALSRALGDVALQSYLSCDPYISETQLDKEQDKFLILACDGLWDIFTDEVSVSIVKSETDPMVASQKLRDRAFNSNSTDNISVIIVFF